VVETIAPAATLSAAFPVLSENVGGGVTVSVTGCVFVIPLHVALTVTGNVPVIALLLAVSVSTLLPLPFASAEIAGVENEGVTPDGRPLTARLIGPGNVPVGFETDRLMSLFPVCGSDKELRSLVNVNENGVMVRVTVAVGDGETDPPVPVRTIEYVPGVTEEFVWSVNGVVPLPAAKLDVPSVAVTPDGTEPSDNVIGELNP
jgi:hypothetical protein